MFTFQDNLDAETVAQRKCCRSCASTYATFIEKSNAH